MILHTNNDLFSELIQVTAEDMDIPPLYIEKDYWVTYILKLLSSSEYIDIAIFKGGTSLSKAYKVIERFSEDIDLAVISHQLNSNEIKKLIKNIEKKLLDGNFKEIQTPQTSKGSQFRKTVHQYSKIEDGDFGHANENILLELNSFTHPHPYLKKSITSYIHDFLETNAAELITEHELESFDVNVLDYRRTFCEKLSAIARASFECDDELSTLKEKIRHLYDIYFLMKQDDIKIFLQTEDFIVMMNNVRIDDQTQFTNSGWASVKLYSTLVFSDTEITLDKLKTFYNSIFSTLVYGNKLPSMESIIVEIKKLSAILIEKDL